MYWRCKCFCVVECLFIILVFQRTSANLQRIAEGIRIGAKDNCARLLERCAHYGASVIMGSDAHCEADAGNHRYAIELLEELQFPEDLIVNTSLDRAASFLPCLAARLDEPLLRAREADARRAPSHSAAADKPSVGGGMEK